PGHYPLAQGASARCNAHGRDVRRIAIEEAPRLVRPIARVVHADARAAHDTRSNESSGSFDPERIAEEVRTVQRAIDVERAAEQPWAVRRIVDAAHRL